MTKVAEETSPWAAFTVQLEQWDVENLKKLAGEWPELTKQCLSIGDATIKNVAQYYADLGSYVEILTGDEGLKAYQPPEPLLIPRRRKR